MGHPTHLSTGVTVYDRKKLERFCDFQAQEVGAVLMNMNGREVRCLERCSRDAQQDFPGGYLLTSRGRRSGKYSVQDGLDVIQVDWDGNIVWKFDRNEFIDDPGIPGRWMARYHHDFQREGSTTGYYAPGMEPKTDSGNTLVLAHRNARNPKISDKQLLDDVILRSGLGRRHRVGMELQRAFRRNGLQKAPKNTLARNPNYRLTQPRGHG